MIEDKIFSTIKKYNLINENDIVVCGVSGGPDSMCMLDNLRKIKESNKLSFEIVVCHLNHLIREEAILDEEYVINYCKKNNIKINNFYIEAMVKSILGVIFYLIIFIPLYLWLGESMLISISLMLITYIFMEYIGYKILTGEEMNINILPVIIIVLGCIMFVILTFYPLHNFLFFDEVKFGYGILK